MNAVDAAFQKLAKSGFRSRFRLSDAGIGLRPRESVLKRMAD